MTATSSTMRAIVQPSAGPLPPTALTLSTLPIPIPKAGEVLIRVRAFGLNRSELHTRLGLAVGVVFPRVLGIEAAGEVEHCPGGEFIRGQKVFAMMGGMGRVRDGGYAEYTCAPVENVVSFESNLGWDVLGAVPEMLQTAWGAFDTVCDGDMKGKKILIRGGTSSVGLMIAGLAKRKGMEVLATSRDPERKGAAMRAAGVDHVLLEQGDDSKSTSSQSVEDQVRAIVPSGVDCAIELVGTPTLPSTLRSTRPKGVVCFIGMLSNVWTVKDFYPIDYIPKGVRLTAYGGEAEDLPREGLQELLDDVERGKAVIPVGKVYHSLESVQGAHEDMEENRVAGKIVVVV